MKTTLKGRLNQMQIDKAFTRVCKFKRKLKRNTIDNILAIVSGARRPPKRIIPNQITTLKCAYKMFLVVARQGWTTELPFKNTCVGHIYIYIQAMVVGPSHHQLCLDGQGRAVGSKLGLSEGLDLTELLRWFHVARPELELAGGARSRTRERERDR